MSADTGRSPEIIRTGIRSLPNALFHIELSHLGTGCMWDLEQKRYSAFTPFLYPSSEEMLTCCPFSSLLTLHFVLLHVRKLALGGKSD